MPIYEYKALGKNGKTKVGILDADNPKDAREKLRMQGIRPMELKEVKGASKKNFSAKNLFGNRKNAAMLAMVTRQLSTLTNSGIPLREAIGALINQLEDRTYQAAFREIREKITSGKQFADALALYPHIFSDLYIHMIRAGEASGKLDNILARLSDYLQAQNRMKGKISAAMAYPLVMMFIGIAVVTFLMTSVIPKIQKVLLEQERQLPLPTKIMVGLSDFLVNWWWLVIMVIFCIIWGFRTYKETERGKRKWHSLLISIPVFGELFKKQSVSRFAVTFSTLLGSGIPALESLRILRNVVDNVIMTETIDEISKKIVEGGDIAGPMQKSKVFPPLVGYMISVGEKTGKLEMILSKIAETYDEEIEVTIQKVTSLMEPIMIVALSMVVGFIVMAIMLPIMEMSKVE